MPDRQKVGCVLYMYIQVHTWSLFQFFSHETSSRKYEIIDDDDDDDAYTLHTKGQSTCKDYIPSARRRKKKETGREKKIN